MGVPKDSGASLGTRRAPHGPTSTPGARPGRASAAACTAARAASAGNPRGGAHNGPATATTGAARPRKPPRAAPAGAPAPTWQRPELLHKLGPAACSSAAPWPCSRDLSPGSCCFKRGGAPQDREGGWGHPAGCWGLPEVPGGHSSPRTAPPPPRVWGAAEKTEVGPGELPRPSRRHQIFLIPPAGITNKTPVPTANKTSLLLQA